MKTISRSIIVAFVLAILLFQPRVAAMGDWPVCAVVEVDQLGEVWVNGKADNLNSDSITECVEGGIYLVMPEYLAPVGEFAEVLIRLRDRDRVVKVYMPSLRRDINDVFGMDMLLMCQEFTEHTIQPVPPVSDVSQRSAVTVIGNAGDNEGVFGATVLETVPSTHLGLADDVAASIGAYDQRGGVIIAVISKGIRREIRLEESDHWYPPPPKLDTRIIDGVKRRQLVDDRQLCIYPGGVD